MMAELFTFDIWTVSLLIAFATCLLSFNWGMYRFFTEPSGSNSGIDTIKLLGTALGFISLSGIPLFGIASALGGLTALLLCAASLALFWWAIRANRTRPLSFAFSEDEPSHLVSTGPYRWIRHPFYSAYLLAWLAVPVATLQPLMLMPLLAMGAIYVSAARVEEGKFETSVLAAAYARYRDATGAFLPRRWH
ncbi:methyltransferase family protein [Nevskia ramosa]|uniref:methyltransferase family protein n=1 Tax=Nevskia ramosa TaxID=64002 RepID=UPI000401070A|nr:methyltransferase [Nevskia ramosa]